MAEKTNTLRMQIIEINDKIEETSSKIAGPYQKRIKEAEQRKREAEGGINTEIATLASSERNVKKSKKKLADAENDIRVGEIF